MAQTVTYKLFLYRSKLQDSEGAWKLYNESHNEEYRGMKPAAQRKYLKETFPHRTEMQERAQTRRRRQAEKNFMKKNNVRQVMVKFNLATDEKELFEYLYSQKNMQGYVKKLLRADMEQNKNS